MRGQISTYDNKKGEGRIQGEDGHIYWFNRDCLERGEDVDYLMMDIEVNFNSGTKEVLNRRTNEMEQRQAALDITIPNPIPLDEQDIYYQEPSSFLFEKNDLVDGFDILDRGLYSIQCSERTEDKARYRLQRDCEDFGANACVSFKVDLELKNAMGNGFHVYHARGVPVVLARRDPNGEWRPDELRNRLNQEKIKKAHNIIVNTRIGKMVVKALAVVLIIIFCLGFILTGGI